MTCGLPLSPHSPTARIEARPHCFHFPGGTLSGGSFWGAACLVIQTCAAASVTPPHQSPPTFRLAHGPLSESYQGSGAPGQDEVLGPSYPSHGRDMGTLMSLYLLPALGQDPMVFLCGSLQGAADGALMGVCWETPGNQGNRSKVRCIGLQFPVPRINIGSCRSTLSTAGSMPDPPKWAAPPLAAPQLLFRVLL